MAAKWFEYEGGKGKDSHCLSVNGSVFVLSAQQKRFNDEPSSLVANTTVE